MEKSVKSFKCDICNKNYKSINSLGNHNRKFHPEKCRKTSRITQKSSIDPQKSSFYPQKYSKNDNISKLECQYCFKIFTRSDNLKRHIKM